MRSESPSGISSDVHSFYSKLAPHPKFSNRSEYSGLEELLDDLNDERKIIRCLNNSDVTGLRSMLIGTNLDVTKIIDENGYTLAHLAAYVNSDKCMLVLFEHLFKRTNKV